MGKWAKRFPQNWIVETGVGFDDPCGSLPIWDILWFCEMSESKKHQSYLRNYLWNKKKKRTLKKALDASSPNTGVLNSQTPTIRSFYLPRVKESVAGVKWPPHNSSWQRAGWSALSGSRDSLLLVAICSWPGFTWSTGAMRYSWHHAGGPRWQQWQHSKVRRAAPACLAPQPPWK